LTADSAKRLAKPKKQTKEISNQEEEEEEEVEEKSQPTHIASSNPNKTTLKLSPPPTQPSKPDSQAKTPRRPKDKTRQTPARPGKAAPARGRLGG
jgi:hypothetical protein